LCITCLPEHGFLNFHTVAGQLFLSGMLLLYTAIIAPVQVFVWEFDEEECNLFPTLYFDIGVDIFFLVRQPLLISIHFLCLSWTAHFS
jgi:hypothetical protein